jgi:hypothetical protein
VTRPRNASRSALGRRLDAAVGELGQAIGIVFAGDESFDHRPTGQAHDIGDDRIELDVGILQCLLKALDMAAPFAHELLAGTQQSAQLLRRGIRHKAAADQPMRHQIGQPGGIVDIGLASRDVLNVPGIGQYQGKIAVAQNVPNRLPVDPGCLHRHVRDPLAGQPFRQSQEVPCRRLERPHLHHVTRASHHRLLVDVETGAMRMQHFHGSPPIAPPAWDPPSQNSRNRAPGPLPTRGALRGARESRVQLADGLDRTKEIPTSPPVRRCATLSRRASRFHAPGVGNAAEPMAAVTAPAQVAAKHQSLLHFVGNAPWSDTAMLAKVGELVLPAIERGGPVEAWIIDDTGFPKKGRHSVGVTRQYCGQLGKQDNCQVAVTLSLANHNASLPVAYRLYLPEDRAKDQGRRRKAKIPETIAFQTKPGIALEQIKAARMAALPRGVVLMDAGYGNDTRLRTAITALDMSYVAGSVPIPRSGRQAQPLCCRMRTRHWAIPQRHCRLGCRDGRHQHQTRRVLRRVELHHLTKHSSAKSRAYFVTYP